MRKIRWTAAIDTETCVTRRDHRNKTYYAQINGRNGNRKAKTLVDSFLVLLVLFLVGYGPDASVNGLPKRTRTHTHTSTLLTFRVLAHLFGILSLKWKWLIVSSYMLIIWHANVRPPLLSSFRRRSWRKCDRRTVWQTKWEQTGQRTKWRTEWERVCST